MTLALGCIAGFVLGSVVAALVCRWALKDAGVKLPW